MTNASSHDASAGAPEDDGGEAPAPETTKEKKSPFAGEDWSFRAWLRLFRDLYFSFDRRTLGFTRILLGFLLVMDIIHRGAAWDDMYSTIGVLPNHVNLQRPQAWGAFTIFNAFSTPGELKVLWFFMLANAICLLAGYKTKAAQIIALIFQASMNGRVLLIENGGYVVNNLLFLWTMFLPLGDRFSVDALLASYKRRRETTAEELNDRSDMLAPGMEKMHVSLLGFVLMLQIGAIYYFNVIHKTGPAWHNGTAVHYVLYNDRMATPIIGLLRDYVPNFAIFFMTRSAMAFEAAIPVLLLQPLARPWARRGVVFMMCCLHLAFGTTFTLGPFAWSCCVFSTLLFSREDWEISIRTMRRTHRARTVLFDPRSGGALAVCRLLKRLDRYELLTFEAKEGIPLGIAIEGQKSRAHMLADIVAAFPLGPCVAWLFRAPVLSGIVESLLATIEKRDASGFFGLRVEGPKGEGAPPAIETPRIPALAIILPVLVVAGAVYAAVKIDKAVPSVTLVAVAVILSSAAAAWAVYPTLTTRALRRVVTGSVREALIMAFFWGAIVQASNELWCTNRRGWKLPQPEPVRLLSHKLRFLQGWFMFSPNPVMDDGTIVVDAITVDGRHVDPFTLGNPPYTLREPNFDLTHAKSLWLTQVWGDYFNRIQLPANTAYRESMKEYIYRLPQRTGHPEDAIVSGTVYWVKDMNPRWNETTSYGLEKVTLFSFENPKIQAAN
jgi:hypothetical protein